MSSCPYCGVVLDPEPKRKRKCPSCEKMIYVRTVGDRKTLITEKEENRLMVLGWKKMQAESRAMFKKQLQEAIRGRYATHVKILACRDERVCEICKSLDGKVFTVQEALEKMPLPANCPTEWCRCVYTYETRR